MMDKIRGIRRAVWPRGLLVALFLVILAVPGYTQFRIEANLGLNLFSFSDPTMETAWYLGDTSTKLADIEIDLTLPIMPAFGAYAGYGFGAFELGAEFAFFKGEGESGEVYIDGIPVGAVPGDFDMQFIRFGPVLRFYFNVGNPRLVPLVGAAVDYVMVNVDIPYPPLKFKQGQLGIGAFGGVLYFFQPNLYVGGVFRADYYLTVVKDELTVDMSAEGGTIADKMKDIAIDGWIPASIYVYIGYRL